MALGAITAGFFAYAQAQERQRNTSSEAIRRIAQQLRPNSSPLVPMAEVALDPIEKNQLDDIYSTAIESQKIPGIGGNPGRQRAASMVQWAAKFKEFTDKHSESAWVPAVNLQVGRYHVDQLNYTEARERYMAAYHASVSHPEPIAQSMAEAAAHQLAWIAATTGDVAQFEALSAPYRKAKSD